MNAKPKLGRQSEGNDLAASYRHSRLADAQHFRGKRLQAAEPLLDRDDCRLDLKVCHAGKQELDFAWVQFTGVTPLPAGVSRAELHLEVLANEGRYGFLLRLIRRGYMRCSGRPIDLYRRVFRVLKRPMEVMGRDFVGGEPCGEVGLTLTPARLAELVPHLDELCIVLGGVHIHVNALFHNGRLHRVAPAEAMLESQQPDPKEPEHALSEMTASDYEALSRQVVPALRAGQEPCTLNAAETKHTSPGTDETQCHTIAHGIHFPSTPSPLSGNHSNTNIQLPVHILPADNGINQSSLSNTSEDMNAHESVGQNFRIHSTNPSEINLGEKRSNLGQEDVIL